MLQGGDLSNAKLWIMPVVLEMFAFAFSWISVQMLHDHEPWRAIAEYALTGITLCVVGVVWAVFRKRIAKLWNKLRGKKTAVAQSSIVTLHNVQCLGVRTGERAADIGFVNVEILNRTVASFHRARLKIRYSLAHSGQAVEIVFPARWIDSDEYDISIGFVPEYAVLAVQIGSKWYGVETEEVLMPHAEIESYNRRKLKPLPSGKLRIEATLIGENNLSLAPFTGTLTLGENGMASFDSK